ncbi:extracellular solute-binding protein [Labrys monachus]|uniref:Peptide/nickel transport system substrate-binding protein n=1 Tax=Labrys monachus TaxID=217067 RepID=A0ABU0FF41_9HYPH|nr:extracellular solute-binding protein [Labrys monachus]MDQ0392942.1 peptide/nickel transport system substrate-binding protein [Labrys monachus]
MALLSMAALAVPAARADPVPAIAMHGAPALPSGFQAFPYVDADAPKGGSVAYAMLGTFDSVNPFIVNGAPSPSTTPLVVETLMARSADEPFTFYPLIATTIDTPPDRSWAEFSLDPRARFSDGEPITAEDLKFTVELLTAKGRPGARANYGQITKIEIKDPHRIRFIFKDAANRELPLLLAGMPVLPKHAIDPGTFDQTTLKPMIGSGPYMFDGIDPGRSISFRKDPNWWGKDLPSNRGFFNFDRIRYEYYRDPFTMFEAFKTHQYDVRAEGEASRWAQDYNFPPARDGRVLRQEIGNGLPKPMNAFVFNTRRPLLRDPRVREALAMLFDFQWVNPNLYLGLYRRPCGYFDGSMLSSCGRPADDREKALLAPFPDAVRPDVMAGQWRPPASDGTGRDRFVARKALALLNEAGWHIAGGLMRKDGRPLRFEIMVPDKATERLALIYADSAQQLGIGVSVRLVDDAQYQQRKQVYNFDLMQVVWQNSLSPGSEQSFRWGSSNVDQPGSFNFAGADSPAIDAMISALLAARGQEDFVAAVRALDRVLISGSYVIPLFYAPKMWIARWNDTTRPDKPAMAVGAYGDTLASDPILAHARAPVTP